MAQPVFDEHPLQEYFRETGETAEPIPGDFMTESGGDGLQSPTVTSALLVQSLFSRVQMPSSFLQALQSALAHFSSSNRRSPRSSFAERFKYDVISSSLLSASLAATPLPSRRSFTPELPGMLETSEHSRTSSSTAVQLEDEPSAQKDETIFDRDLSEMKGPVGVISLAVVALASGYEFLAYLLFAVAFYVARAVKPAPDKADAATLTLDALNELISAGNLWDSAVNEAMSIVEKEERNPSAYYGLTSSSSPLATLRVALQSVLHTTQSQCDSVRELLSALTSPVQLSQLSEMYAPPSPVKPSFISLDHPRPLSDPVASWHRRSMPPGSNATSPTSKRATWNGGTYSSLTLSRSGSPLQKRDRDRDKRRSQLNALFPADNERSVPASAPSSPLRPLKLQDVQEEDQSELPYTLDENVFGVAALELRRKRQSAGMEAFGVPPPSYSSHLGGSPGHALHHSLSSFTSPSRFTLLQTNRHPLSLSALNLALQGALSAKRYACSHLLALRFEEDEDDAPYWEDVRSVMALLTSTFSDASARLLGALDEAEKQRMKDQRPSTESLVGSSRDNSVSPNQKCKMQPMKKMAEMVSFAPMPSHLARFATHVDTLSTALNDAREHLEHCVASLRIDGDLPADDPMTPPADRAFSDVFSADSVEDINPTLAAYDRFRKELGFALRECERGRERLLDVIAAMKPAPSSDDDEEDEIEPVSPVPPLAHDASSEESAGLESLGFGEKQSILELTVSEARPWDDVTDHLILTASSEHLPPPGIEQVFEAESGSPSIFTRERSKLSREERIRLAKARRESGQVSEPQEMRRKGSMEQWGPGGEVVQELKDVIWKVGEKRRKMWEATTPEPESAPAAILSVHVNMADDDAHCSANLSYPLPRPPLAPEPEELASMVAAS